MSAPSLFVLDANLDPVVATAAEVADAAGLRRARHEPGNGTRYDLWLVGSGDAPRLLGWTNAPGGGRCMLVPAEVCGAGGPALDAGYVAEKMGLNAERDAADLRVVLLWCADLGVRVAVRGW